MQTPGARPSRRAVLAFGTGGALAAALSTGASAYAATPGGASAPEVPEAARPESPGAGGLAGRLRGLERKYTARLGVFARNTATGGTVSYRADERFPICSVFKPLAAAAVLRDLDHDGEFLARRIRYTERLVRASGYAPVTGLPGNLAHGLTVGELCAAAVSHSDNAAANLLLRELGGPAAVTRFCRSTGDRRTRLDRWEPALNSAEPWRVTDTTSPRAIGGTFGNLVVGEALTAGDRQRLTTWLTENSTNGERFGAGLPADWTLADKTGGGSQYGVANDVGVVRPPGGPPIVLSVLSVKPDPEGPTDNPLVAKAAELVAAELT